MQNNNLSGFIFINKPKNISSFDCIRYIKKILKQKIKIGHTGTLDNFATGLLIICIGREATKNINSFMNLDKEYIFSAKLGELTDTLDHTGKIIEQKNKFKISKNDLENAIAALGKSYTQIPPIYSALKHKGKSLYKLARNNKLSEKELEKIAEQKKRIIKIYNIDLLNFDFPYFEIKTCVSKGTYIRSLANDISQKIKIPSTTYKLERTKIGNFSIKNSINLYDLKTVDDIKNNLILPTK